MISIEKAAVIAIMAFAVGGTFSTALKNNDFETACKEQGYYEINKTLIQCKPATFNKLGEVK